MFLYTCISYFALATRTKWINAIAVYRGDKIWKNEVKILQVSARGAESYDFLMRRFDETAWSYYSGDKRQ